MQIHTVTRQHPLTAVAAAANPDIRSGKDEALERAKRIATTDDRLAGSMLAAEVVATAKNDSNIWRRFAITIIGMTAEARAAFLDAIKNEKSALTKAQTEFGIDKKSAQQRTASFGVQVSKLTTIAKAFNGAATVAGWREFVNLGLTADKTISDDDDMLAHGGYETLVQYARLFTKSAAGRTPDTWTVTFGKFLERNKPADDAPKAELSHYNAAVALFNTMV